MGQMIGTHGGLPRAIAGALIDRRGWSLDRLGVIVNMTGPLAGMASAMLTGWLANRLGRRRILLVAAAVQLLAVFAVAAAVMATAIPAAAVAACAVGYFLLYTPAATALAVVMMDRTAGEAPATDYCQDVCRARAAIRLRAMPICLTGGASMPGSSLDR